VARMPARGQDVKMATTGAGFSPAVVGYFAFLDNAKVIRLSTINMTIKT